MPGPCKIRPRAEQCLGALEETVARERIAGMAVPGRSAGRLKSLIAPRAIAHPLQAQSVRDLLRRHCCAVSSSLRCASRASGQVLLVREDEQQAILHLAVLQDPMQLLLRLVDPLLVLAVDDEDEALRAGVVVPPQWPDLVLSSDVPA